MKTVLFAAVAGLAASANADIVPFNAFDLTTAQVSGGQLYSVGTTSLKSVIPGDAFTAEPLAQTTSGAFFTDDGAGSVFAFGTAASGGNNLTNTGSISVVNSVQINNANSTFTVASSVAHFNSAGGLVPWVASGVSGPNAAPFVSWRFDVGSTSGGTNPIDISLAAGEFINVLSANFLVFNSAGSVLATFSLSLDTSNSSSLSGLGLVGLGGANIAGFDLSGMEIQWTYEVVPTPASAAVLGFGGLLAARRRR
jgi:hypothetical protein